MTEILIYTTGYCPYCARAKDLLKAKNLLFTEIRIDLQPDLRAEMEAKSGRVTVPQLFINGQSIGGCDDLYALEETGALNQLLRG